MTVSFVDYYLCNYTHIYMHKYHGTINRQTGLGMNFIRFHLNVHRPDDLIKYGSLANIDTETGKKCHKQVSKLPSKNTQRQGKKLDHQAAQRYSERAIIERAYSKNKFLPDQKRRMPVLPWVTPIKYQGPANAKN